MNNQAFLFLTLSIGLLLTPCQATSKETQHHCNAATTSAKNTLGPKVPKYAAPMTIFAAMSPDSPEYPEMLRYMKKHHLAPSIPK